jgi:ribose/xylose/arabinose/galactoside ABC-type transport system permease subunit
VNDTLSEKLQQVLIGAMVIVAVFYDRWQRGRR